MPTRDVPVPGPLTESARAVADALPAIPGGWGEATIPLDEHRVRLLLPADPDAVLDEPGLLERCGATGEDPYWCFLWPASVTLARAVVRESWPDGTRVLELGCGIGLAGLAAAAVGLPVTFTDNQERAVTLATANARLGGFEAEGRMLDWRRPAGPRFPLILGGDLLYEPTLHAALLDTLDALLEPGGVVWLSDAGRPACRTFLGVADDRGWSASLFDADGNPMSVPWTAKYQRVVLRRRVDR